MLKNNTKVKFKCGNIEGTGTIRGKASKTFPFMGAFYIVEIIESNIDKKEYDYPCVSLQETCLELIN